MPLDRWCNAYVLGLLFVPAEYQILLADRPKMCFSIHLWQGKPGASCLVRLAIGKAQCLYGQAHCRVVHQRKPR